MKTHLVEIQKIKAMNQSHGLLRAKVELLVQPRQNDTGDGSEPSSVLTMTVENARVLYLLLKQQLAEVDAKKGRSQR